MQQVIAGITVRLLRTTSKLGGLQLDFSTLHITSLHNLRLAMSSQF